MGITQFSSILEGNGKTIKENNLGKLPVHALGAIVKVTLDLYYPGYQQSDGVEVNLKGKCTLYVVGHMRDCDGTPLYILSDIPVVYPVDEPMLSQQKLLYDTYSHVMEHGYGEDSLKATGRHRSLFPTLKAWLFDGPDVELGVD